MNTDGSKGGGAKDEVGLMGTIPSLTAHHKMIGFEKRWRRYEH